MLEYEFLQCQLTLNNDRGDNTQFFAFADTVVAKAYKRDNECHGWLGIKYQGAPKKEPCSVMIHCRMLEPTAQQQQESLGILGVNLIHAALTHHEDPYNMIKVQKTESSSNARVRSAVGVAGRFEPRSDRDRCDALCRS